MSPGQLHQHQPVLLDEALEAMKIRSDGCYVDGTFGRGGHSSAILMRLGAAGRLYALDKDPEAVTHAREMLASDSRFHIAHASFAELEAIATQNQLTGRVDGLLLDLGVSSPQLDDFSRGFSFQQDGPLDMRMDTKKGMTAAQWLATAEESTIARVLKEYGEERFAWRIARAIVAARVEESIDTTGKLAELIVAANPSREKHKHPATRSFQAIRIYINSELEELRSCLQQSVRVLATGARLVVISFHSLEDRIVKRFLRELAHGEIVPKGVPVRQSDLKPALLSIVGKVIKPSAAEISINPRARSAVMRVAEMAR